MKYIIKLDEPQVVLDWKGLATDEWQPSYDDLRGREKQEVKESLMREQGYICCYCERRLHNGDSHIEHFLPQHDERCDPLNYANLLCSCQNRLERGEPRHCGNLKGDWFDDELLVSPLTEGCASRFAFSGDGSIRPAVTYDRAAAVTIEKLGLNLRKLQDMRKSAIEPFLDPSLSNEELQHFAQGYLAPDVEGRFGEFWSTIAHLFGHNLPVVYSA